MSPKRKRRLWLRIFFKVPPGISREVVLQTLLQSIQDGTYAYPPEWRVVIQWRNRENDPMREGPFTAEMRRSAQSSRGFDKAVISYLENQQ